MTVHVGSVHPQHHSNSPVPYPLAAIKMQVEVSGKLCVTGRRGMGKGRYSETSEQAVQHPVSRAAHSQGHHQDTSWAVGDLL